MTIRSHPYRGEADFRRMRTFLIKARVRGQYGYWHIGDLVWRLLLQSCDGDPAQNLNLWEDEAGDLLGFAGYYRSQSFDLQVHPDYRQSALVEEMLDWIEARWQNDLTSNKTTRDSLPTQEGGATRLSPDEGVYETDINLIALLNRRSYEQRPGDQVLMVRPLDGPVPEPALPDGFTLRAVSGEGEADERSAAHREAFGAWRVTVEAYQRLMRTSGYDRDLDVVAVAPDGRCAAFCLGWIDPVNGIGELEPVGTRPDFRHLGLGQAVMLESLRRMKSRGLQEVIVGPVKDNLIPFYEPVGFRVRCKTYNFYKEKTSQTDEARRNHP